MKILYRPHTIVFCITPDMFTGSDIDLLFNGSERECLMADCIIRKVKKQAAIELMARYDLKPLELICDPVSYSRESQMDFINVEANWSKSNMRHFDVPPTLTVTYYIKAVVAKGQKDINFIKLKNPSYYEQYRVEDYDYFSDYH